MERKDILEYNLRALTGKFTEFAGIVSGVYAVTQTKGTTLALATAGSAILYLIGYTLESRTKERYHTHRLNDLEERVKK